MKISSAATARTRSRAKRPGAKRWARRKAANRRLPLRQNQRPSCQQTLNSGTSAGTVSPARSSAVSCRMPPPVGPFFQPPWPKCSLWSLCANRTSSVGKSMSVLIMAFVGGGAQPWSGVQSAAGVAAARRIGGWNWPSTSLSALSFRPSRSKTSTKRCLVALNAAMPSCLSRKSQRWARLMAACPPVPCAFSSTLSTTFSNPAPAGPSLAECRARISMARLSAVVRNSESLESANAARGRGVGAGAAGGARRTADRFGAAVGTAGRKAGAGGFNHGGWDTFGACEGRITA
mmetsp:Transcript_102091/g.304727  ORF Transcript_102091/g.304727 Transcript_102091/m.304727 type:complete len:290 (-) Transcript_102091:587-1456(-)